MPFSIGGSKGSSRNYGSSVLESTKNTSGTSLINEVADQQSVMSGSQQLTEFLNSITTGSQISKGTTAEQAQGTELQRVSQFGKKELDLLRTIAPQILDRAVANFSLQDTDAAFQQATQETQGSIAALTRQLREQVLPGIINEEAISGAYNSTQGAFLANDAIARAAELGSTIQLNRAEQIQNRAQQALAPAIDFFSLLRGAETTSVGQNAQTRTGQTAQDTSSTQSTNQMSEQTSSTQQSSSQRNSSQQSAFTSEEERMKADEQNYSQSKGSGFSVGFASS